MARVFEPIAIAQRGNPNPKQMRITFDSQVLLTTSGRDFELRHFRLESIGRFKFEFELNSFGSTQIALIRLV